MKSFFFLSAALLVSSPLDAANAQTKAASTKPVAAKSVVAKPASAKSTASKVAVAKPKPTRAASTSRTTPGNIAVATGTSKGVSARDLRIRQKQTTGRQAALPTAKATTTASTQKSKWPAMDLIIPEIGINAPIVHGIDDEPLKRGVGVDPLSSVPGVPGNSVIAGHRNVWGAWFWDLPRLKPGSQIFVKTPEATFTYKVAFARVVPPHDTSLLEPPTDPKVTRLTLYTCTKPKTENRFVVVANLVSKDTAPVAIPGSTLVTTKTTAPKATAPLATLPRP